MSAIGLPLCVLPPEDGVEDGRPVLRYQQSITDDSLLLFQVQVHSPARAPPLLKAPSVSTLPIFFTSPSALPTAGLRTCCLTSGMGRWGGAAAGIPEILRGKGPATMTFLSSRENYKQMWVPQGAVEEGASGMSGTGGGEWGRGGQGGSPCSCPPLGIPQLPEQLLGVRELIGEGAGMLCVILFPALLSTCSRSLLGTV